MFNIVGGHVNVRAARVLTHANEKTLRKRAAISHAYAPATRVQPDRGRQSDARTARATRSSASILTANPTGPSWSRPAGPSPSGFAPAFQSRRCLRPWPCPRARSQGSEIPWPWLGNPEQIWGGDNSFVRNPGQIWGGSNSFVRNPSQFWGGNNSVFNNPAQLAPPPVTLGTVGGHRICLPWC